jgi:DNA-directed RNA polymerase subunit RPC12/RpoP
MPRPFKCSNCKKTWDAKLADIYEFIGNVCRECEEKLIEKNRLADSEQEQIQLDYALELSKVVN